MTVCWGLTQTYKTKLLEQRALTDNDNADTERPFSEIFFFSNKEDVIYFTSNSLHPVQRCTDRILSLGGSLQLMKSAYEVTQVCFQPGLFLPKMFYHLADWVIPSATATIERFIFISCWAVHTSSNVVRENRPNMTDLSSVLWFLKSPCFQMWYPHSETSHLWTLISNESRVLHLSTVWKTNVALLDSQVNVGDASS